MFKLGIRARTLFLLLVVTLVPLLLLNFFWTYVQRSKLTHTVTLQQAAITENAADNVSSFVHEKTRALIIHSQSSSVLPPDAARATRELEALIYQDKDLLSVTLANKSGQEIVSLDNNLKPIPLKNIATSDSFRVVNFLAGKEYLSPVTQDESGRPIMTITVPLVAFTKPQDLTSISTAESGIIRNSNDIQGALIAKISLEGLWKSVLANAQNKSSTDSANSYAYVVDDKGSVITHPDSALASSRKDLSSVPIVSEFLRSRDGSATSKTMETTSERGIPSLATYQKIPSTSWAVVFQEPISSIYLDVSQVSQLGLGLTLVAIVVVTVLSFLASRYITSPILKIAAAAQRIGRGEFDTTVHIKRSDEIGALAERINLMGQSLKQYIAHVETERKQLGIILNSNAESIIAVNKDNQIVIANQAAANLAKQTHDMLIGQSMQSVFPWMQARQPFVVDYTHEGVNTYQGLEYTGVDKLTHYVDLVVARVNASPEGVQAIITIHDMTKSRDLEKMKVDFVSMAAHELRTPITAIRGYLELILYRFGDNVPEQVKAYIQQTHKSTLELIGLINNLLNISRIERGALTLAMEKVDWAEAIRHTVETVQFTAQEKHITVACTGTNEPKFIVADPIAIQEVLNNLVSNALRYTPENGTVTVRLHTDGERYITEIHDTGIGIPANALPNLFTKFYRVHGGLASGSGGTGLGLFISKSIVERHDGTIWVESKEGEGSTFAFTLPAFTEERLGKHKHTQDQTVRRQRGWITKNIAR